MGGAATGAVELYHRLGLGQGGEPLRAPLTSVVGGLVTDFDSHGVGCVDAVSLQGQGGAAAPCVPLQKLTARRSVCHIPERRSAAAALRSARTCRAYAERMASLSPTHWRPSPVTGVRVMPRPLPPAELHAMLPLTPSAPLPRLPIALCWLCSAMVVCG